MLTALLCLAFSQSPLQQLKYEVAQLKAENIQLKAMLYGPVTVPTAAAADQSKTCPCPPDCTKCSGNCANCTCQQPDQASQKIDNRDGKQCWKYPDGRCEYMGPNGEHTGRFYDLPQQPQQQLQLYQQPMPMFSMPMFGGGGCPGGS